MLLIKYITLLCVFCFTTAVFATCKNDILVCYGKLNPKDITGYKYVIIESEHYSKDDVNLIKQHNEIVLCYISLGEVNVQANYYPALKNFVTDKNEIWNSYYLNLSSLETKEALRCIISEKLEKGFDGLFLDNIDNYSTYGKQSDQREDLVLFLTELRTLYPSLFFIQNSGLQLLDETHELINALAFESVASDYSFKTNTYAIRENLAYNKYINTLKAHRKSYKLPIILIEYAGDYKLYKRIESRVKHTKWSYFIGKIDLQTINNYSKN
ncbi:MAG: endo alpha-1,4 polygalactosaminidase [Flavobacteriaceae bacterium]